MGARDPPDELHFPESAGQTSRTFPGQHSSLSQKRFYCRGDLTPGDSFAGAEIVVAVLNNGECGLPDPAAAPASRSQPVLDAL